MEICLFEAMTFEEIHIFYCIVGFFVQSKILFQYAISQV